MRIRFGHRWCAGAHPIILGASIMDLSAKINSGSAVIGVIGLGYVGLPLLNAFHQAGHRVVGFDIDAKKIQMLKKGENYLKHLGEGFLKAMLSSGRFDAT